MISLTRLNGERIAVNPDLLERAEETPDTVLTLTNGTKYVVSESLDELVERVQRYRAGTLALARRWADDPDAATHFRLHLVSSEPEPEVAAGNHGEGGEGPVMAPSADDASNPDLGSERATHSERAAEPETAAQPERAEQPDTVDGDRPVGSRS